MDVRKEPAFLSGSGTVIALLTAAGTAALLSLSACAPAVGPHQSVSITLKDSALTNSLNDVANLASPGEYCYVLHVVDEDPTGSADLRSSIWDKNDCDSAPNSIGQLYWLGNGKTGQQVQLPINNKPVRFDFIAVKTAQSGAKIGPDASCAYNISIANAAAAAKLSELHFALTPTNTSLDTLTETDTFKFDMRLLASKRNYQVVSGANKVELSYAPTFTNSGDKDFGLYGKCDAEPKDFCDYGLRRQYDESTGKLFARTTIDNDGLVATGNAGLTANTAVEICSESQLLSLNSADTSAIRHVTLESDLDFDGTTIEPIARDDDIGFQSNLDGKKHSISNLYVRMRESGDRAGLFSRLLNLKDELNGHANESREIKNLTLVNIDVQGQGSAVLGGLAGETQGYNLTNISLVNDNKHFIYSDQYTIGGLVGYVAVNSQHSTLFKNLFASTAVSGQYNVAGLFGQVGASEDGSYFTLTESGFIGSVDASNFTAAGLVSDVVNDQGAPANFVFSDNLVLANVRTYNTIGMLAGHSYRAVFLNSYIAGKLSSNETSAANAVAGGLVGSGTNSNFDQIVNEVRFDMISSLTGVGQLVGTNSNSTFSNTVTNTDMVCLQAGCGALVTGSNKYIAPVNRDSQLNIFDEAIWKWNTTSTPDLLSLKVSTGISHFVYSNLPYVDVAAANAALISGVHTTTFRPGIPKTRPAGHTN